MSIVVRGLGGTHLVVRGLAETFGVLLPISAPFEMTEALLAALFTSIAPDYRGTSSTFGDSSMIAAVDESSADINNADTAIKSRPLTAVVHRARTTVLVHGG